MIVVWLCRLFLFMLSAITIIQTDTTTHWDGAGFGH
jgi:hypothetical protein